MIWRVIGSVYLVSVLLIIWAVFWDCASFGEHQEPL